MQPTKNGLALAQKLDSLGASFPEEVWVAIYEERIADFQDHPDYLAFCRRVALATPKSPSPSVEEASASPSATKPIRWYWAVWSVLVKAARWVLRRGKKLEMTRQQKRQLAASHRLPVPVDEQYAAILRQQAEKARDLGQTRLHTEIGQSKLEIFGENQKADK